jgi:hypothetical protein
VSPPLLRELVGHKRRKATRHGAKPIAWIKPERSGTLIV